MSLTGAAVGGVVALTGMCVAHFVRHSSSRSNAAVATPDVLSTLSTACEEGLRLTASRCGCDRLNPESTASARMREVHLDLFLTYMTPKNKTTSFLELELDDALGNRGGRNFLRVMS
jgi:hypothetical protein